MTLPKGVTQADIDLFAKLDDAKAKIDIKYTELKDKIKAAFEAEGIKTKETKIVESAQGQVVFDFGTQNRTDEKAAQAEYSIELRPDLYTKFNAAELTDEERKPFLKPTRTLSVEVVK